MKPTEYKLIVNDDVEEFAEEVTEALKENFSFLGDIKIEDKAFIQPMVKVEMPAVPQTITKDNIPTSFPKKKKEDK